MSGPQTRQGEQRLLFPLPKPSTGGPPNVVDYLLSRPGWKDRKLVARLLGMTDRRVRSEAEHSGGMVIFSSEKGKGLCHVLHASEIEKRACAAELMARANSHTRRAREILAAPSTGAYA